MNSERIRQAWTDADRSIGAAPGTVFANPEAHATRVTASVYRDGEVRVVEEPDVGACRTLREGAEWIWLNVQGLADTQRLQSLADAFSIHGLAIADAVNLRQRPKMEVYEDHVFIVLHDVEFGERLSVRQVALCVGADFLLSFVEQPGALFEPVRGRLVRAGRAMAGHGIDYLAYALIDALVDGYFPVVDRYSDELERVESIILEGAPASVGHIIHTLREDLLILRRSVAPAREVIGELSQLPGWITEPSKFYLRDTYDHAVHLVDIIESYREVVHGLFDLHMASQTARMNATIKVLTLIATIFMPLSFLAGVFGMNFDRRFPWNQPELGWPYGYLYAIGLMVAAVIGLLWYFRRKGWLSDD